MTAWIRARVASCTSGDWLITRDTVFLETLARRAMSLIVALRPGLMPVTFTGGGSRGVARATMVFLRVRVMGLILRNHGDARRFSARICPLTMGRHAPGVMGAVRHLSVPRPVKIASAVCPVPIEWTPVAAPVDM